MEQKLKFNGKWRDYQKRILDNLSFHLADDKIHVVAAPGAGKTTLGIEVIARLNKPTLILAPTITIRNQWKQRITEAFLNGNSEDIISLNIREPKFITVITYQSLLAAFCGNDKPASSNENDLTEINWEEDSCINTYNNQEDELLIEEEEADNNKIKRLNKAKADEVIAILKRAGTNVLCFDEAHHLRNEWWKALTYLIDNLKPQHMVSLTATPPYDADTTEWERYSSLCGSIDEVISIPELVQNGDLCPHQDFLHFSLLRKSESDEINKSIQKVRNFVQLTLNDKDLIKIMQAYLSGEDVEIMLEEPKIYVAIASYLKTAGKKIPENFLATFDLTENDIPKFSEDYQKIFLSFVLLKDNKKLEKYKETISKLTAEAKTAGIIYNKSVYLNDNPKLKRQIANSLGKLDSIKDIVNLEVNALQDKLRMVILADFIKYDVTDCSALGVIPIWQTLKDRENISLCVLTGSIILIPKKLEEEFNKRIKEYNLAEDVSLTPFDRDNNYMKVTAKGGKRSIVVELITGMFNDGHITIMVGTQALLGEGWDAPCINSLILSSTVSSYMLSNQMRGRAIRKDRNNPDKVSNIWHLASIKILNTWETIKQELPSRAQTETESSVQIFDYLQLCQRFKGYEAPSFQPPYYIENGIERILPDSLIRKLQYNWGLLTENDFLKINDEMKTRAVDRQATLDLWKQGLVVDYNTPEKTLRTGVSTNNKMKSFYYRSGYFYILFTNIAFFSAIAIFFLQAGMWPLTFIVLLAFLLVMAKPTYKHLRCSSPEKIMRQIGIVILETLSYMGEIKTSLQHINIQCKQNITDGSIFFSVTNVSPEENNLIIKSIMEFLDPIANPRYIFVRKGKVHNSDTTDYHAIPSVIGQKKENTDIFKGLWQKYIGDCEIIYTRTAEGRKILVKARKAAFSELVQDTKSKKLSRFE